MNTEVKTPEQVVADAINDATGKNVTAQEVATGAEQAVADVKPDEPKSEIPEQVVAPRPPRIGAKPGRETKGGSQAQKNRETKGGSPAQKAKAVKNEAEKKDAGAPGSLTKAQQIAVAASLSAEPAGVKNEGQEKNVDVKLSDGSTLRAVAFSKLPVPRLASTIALTGRPVTKRTKPAARWSAFMEFYNGTPAAERSVEAYALFSAKVAAGKVAGRDKDHAPTLSDLQWAAGKGWVVLV